MSILHDLRLVSVLFLYSPKAGKCRRFSAAAVIQCDVEKHARIVWSHHGLLQFRAHSSSAPESPDRLEPDIALVYASAPAGYILNSLEGADFAWSFEFQPKKA
jgi:hypothetical protein